MQNENRLHVFLWNCLFVLITELKKTVIQHPQNSDYLSEIQTGLIWVSAVEVLMNMVP
jgi:hypothetical protein